MHGVYPGGIDTDMLAGIDSPKTAARRGRGPVAGRRRSRRGGHLPRPQLAAMSELWWADPKGFERAFSGAVADQA